MPGGGGGRGGRVREKLPGFRGEPLAETLVGILGCTLAVVMLMTSVVTAANVNAAAKKSDAELQEGQEAAETHSTKIGETTVTFGGSTYDNVPTYGGDSMASYAMS